MKAIETWQDNLGLNPEVDLFEQCYIHLKPKSMLSAF